MNVVEFLQTIQALAKKYNLSEPFLCGGTPRDKYLNNISNIEDLDLTTGNKDIFKLSKIIANEFKTPLKTFPDGHSQLNFKGIKVDFSSNFIIPNLDKIFLAARVTNLKPMHYELYSRDFTCNALLMSLDFKRILDPTGLGIADINKKLIKTCLPANLTLGYDNKRIVRVIYLAAKLNFNIDQSIVNFIKKYPSLISSSYVKPQYLKNKLNKALYYNKEKTLSLIRELNLWPHLPIKI